MAPDLPASWIGDADRLRQILTNLLGNAIKFTEQGEVRLHIDLADAGSGDTRRLRFAVSDTGPGIAPELQERIFDSFTQGDATSTRRHPGSGLGLAIVREIVVRHGGTVGAANRPAGGAVLTVELPTAG